MTFEVADLYRSLRGRLFITDPKTLGLTQNEDERFWGLAVDFGLEKGVATLVALRDGTISLYFSNGGGLIGLDQHDALIDKADKLMRLAEDFQLEGPEADRDTLPSEGETRFNFLGWNGARALEEADEDLEDKNHALHGLFEAAHALVKAAERIDDERVKGPPPENASR